MTTHVAVNAVLLAENESCLALDRKVLRRLGLTRTHFFCSGREALDHLRAAAEASAVRVSNGPAFTPVPDLLICNERLADMTGLRFLSHVRSMPGITGIPALLFVGNGESTVAIAARATNSCAVLARPYTLDQAREAMHLATLPQARHAPLVLPPSFTDRFGPKTAASAHGSSGQKAPLLKRPAPKREEHPGEIALREGLAALQRGDATAADRLLHGSYQVDPERVETCLALSKLNTFLHKEKEELLWLCRAGMLCLKRGDRSRAGNIFGRLPRGKTGQDPLLAETGLVLQAGEAKAAALGFLEAHRLDPSRPLHALIGRTCMFTPAPEEHMRELVQALSRIGHEATANKLHWRLLQPPREEEENSANFLDNFPLLQDIVSVAAYTFKTWRHAA